MLVEQHRTIDGPPAGTSGPRASRTSRARQRSACTTTGTSPCSRRGRTRPDLARPREARDPRNRRVRASIAFADNDRPGVMLATPRRCTSSTGCSSARARSCSPRGERIRRGLDLVSDGGEVPRDRRRDPGPNPTRPARDAERAAGWVVSGTEGDRWLEAVHLRDPDGDDGRSSAICSSCRAAGTRTSRCGARSAAASGSTMSRRVRPGRRGRRGCRSWAQRPARCRTTRRLVRRRRRHARTSSTSSATRRSPTSPTRSARPALRRAREARHVHRHRDRPGPHERGHHRRDREAPRRVARRQGPSNARPPSRPAPSRARRPVPRRPVRPDPDDPDASVARRAWGAFENVGQWKRPWFFPRDGEPMERAVVRECLRFGTPSGDRRLDARQDRGGGGRRAGVPRPHVHEPDVEPRGRRDPLRAHARARRDGARRRGRDAPRGRPVPRHDHDGRRRDRARPVRGVAPDRVARPARVLHQRDRAVGRGGDRGAAAREVSRRRGPTSTFRARPFRS